MTKNFRIIPRLDIKGPNVVKGIKMEGLRVVGRPELFAAKYYQDFADELVYIDTVASLYGRNSLSEIIHRAAEQIFIPLTVGGGIRTIEDIRNILRVGADKVAINTALFSNPELIKEASESFGAQCIVVSIQARKVYGTDKYECLTDNARENTGVDVFEWVERVVELGAGEILLTSVDRDGTGTGFDQELVRRVSEFAPIPVIASGGAGNLQHIENIATEGKADAVCIGSMLHYDLLHYMEENGLYTEEGNIDFLKKKRGDSQARKTIQPTSIQNIKKYLLEREISVRL
ncbi:imidazole glycerol phosphate synthase subunit HisF [Marinomonas sp. CT5]|uniref:imidazole glycerol phosphate synthase subunit HisF n=1 Tax=Marinomonas sp. CT5 TaxID=2066133 RepID=UPI001BAFDEBF|nr:imidazole glycerol phosphate synthase cyclase subunit [Marinomonas sp. CT5]QUX94513.1 imidazole glycerol phosphate synthase subunit HisF [Marinomonas sp. CT5]